MSPSDRPAAASPERGAERLALLEVLKRSTEFLRTRGCDAPRLDAELLLAKALGQSRLDLYLQFDRPLTADELERCRELVRRRGAREPVAYLLGEKEFRSLAFEVGPAVLVPRPETETLVEEALAFLAARGVPAPRVADVGTGSGCIAVAIAKETPGAEVLCTDVSRAALEVAARNAARHGVANRLQLAHGGFLDPAPAGARFDLVVSNPPYVLPSEEPSLPAELRFEPREALFVPGGDADALLAALASAARERLAAGGALMIEIAETWGARAEAALRAAGLADFRVRRDLAGHDRVAIARSPR